MSAGVWLADLGNIGLLASAALTSAAVIAYAIRGRGGQGRFPPWWRSPFGAHLMYFMIAFAVVLDEAAIYLITTGGVIVHEVPFKADWFAYLRVVSYVVLIPTALGWRLWIILWPPGRGKP